VNHTSPPRVFVLGAARTGTTSLAIYLEEAGFATKHFFPEEAGYIDFASAEDNARAVLAYIAAAPETAFCDHPVRAFWRELADAYPDAHFILSRRESPQKWRASAERYFAELGAAVDIDAAYLDYVVTNARIEDHFAHSGQKFFSFIIDEDSRANAEALRTFLGLPDGPGELPQSNRHHEGEPCEFSADAPAVKPLIDVLPLPSRPLGEQFRPGPVRAEFTAHPAASWPLKRYVVAVTPGAGDDRFAMALSWAGLGYPHHALNDGFWRDAWEVLPNMSAPEYLAWLMRNYSGRLGCFGLSADIYRLVKQPILAPELNAVLTDARLIIFLRQDILLQAINLHRNMVTGVWSSVHDHMADPRAAVAFDGPRILSALRMIVEQEMLQYRWIGEQAAAPLVVWSHALEQDALGVLNAVAGQLGLCEPVTLADDVLASLGATLRFATDAVWAERLKSEHPEVAQILALRPDWLALQARQGAKTPHGAK